MTFCASNIILKVSEPSDLHLKIFPIGGPPQANFVKNLIEIDDFYLNLLFSFYVFSIISRNSV